MKKLLAIFLALLTLLPLAVACQDASDQPAETTASGTKAPDETEDPHEDHVPEFDFKEYEFMIAGPETWGNTYFDREELTDETINDAIYTRNRYLEDRFNIIIRSMNLGYTHEQASKFQTFQVSGEDAIGMIGVAFTQSAKPMITEGLALPWNGIDYINLDKVWWNKSVTQTMAVLGNYYYLSGDINYASMPNVTAWFFNKEVAEKYDIPDLYQTVRDGKWTWDTMNNYIKLISTENGDSTWDEKDTYGHLQYLHSIEGWIYGANYQTAFFTEDGVIMNFATEKMQNIINQVYNMIYDTKYSYMTDDGGVLAQIFFDNRALFLTTVIGNGEGFRQYETDFGIIPNPKYDEKQKEYKTLSDQWGLVLCMPSTTTNPTRTGAIVEAMAAQSNKLIRPAYYEKTLMGKVKRDDESEEMLDIIFAGILYDSGQCYLSNLGWLPMRATVASGNTGLTSWWGSHKKVITQNFEELYDTVRAQKEGTA